MLPKANVLGLGITLASPAGILEGVREMIALREASRAVCAINAHTFTEALRDRRYRNALNGAAIAFIDGVPIRWLLRSEGHAPPARIHGADLMILLLSQLEGARHFLFGSTPEVLSRLQSALHRRFPSLRIVDALSPPFRRAAIPEEPGILDRLNRSDADVLWVGLGAPKQEFWMHLNTPRLRIPVCVGVGAAFDILAERYGRAPRWLQAAGLEWGWRLCQDPARLWRRYFSTNGRFLATLLLESLRRASGQAPPRP